MHAPPAEHLSICLHEDAFHLTGFLGLGLGLGRWPCSACELWNVFLAKFLFCVPAVSGQRATLFLIRPKPRAYTRPGAWQGMLASHVALHRQRKISSTRLHLFWVRSKNRQRQHRWSVSFGLINSIQIDLFCFDLLPQLYEVFFRGYMVTLKCLNWLSRLKKCLDNLARLLCIGSFGFMAIKW